MGIKILVIGEHGFLRTTLRSWLETMLPHCSTLEAANSTEGVAVAESHCPQAIIFYVGFPGLFSLQHIAQLRSRLPQIPLVVLTSFPVDEHCASTLALGASACLTMDQLHTELKPILTTMLDGQFI